MSFPARAPIDRHLVLTLGRSGSNTLLDMLNQNPEVLNVGELLGEWNLLRRWQRRFLSRLTDPEYLDLIVFSDQSARALNLARNVRALATANRSVRKRYRELRSYGFKEFSLNFERYGLADYVRQRSGLKVIGLLRENVLDRMISNAMLARTGVVAVRTDEITQRPRIRIDPGTIVDALGHIERENRFLREMLEALPPARVHIVRYEELFSGPESTTEVMRGIFTFLGVRQIRPEIRMKKIIRGSSACAIENFDECRTAVRGTRFERLLDGES